MRILLVKDTHKNILSGPIPYYAGLVVIVYF